MSASDEEDGMDVVKHGESAYPVSAWLEYQYSRNQDPVILASYWSILLILISNWPAGGGQGGIPGQHELPQPDRDHRGPGQRGEGEPGQRVGGGM